MLNYGPMDLPPIGSCWASKDNQEFFYRVLHASPLRVETFATPKHPSRYRIAGPTSISTPGWHALMYPIPKVTWTIIYLP